MVLVGLYFISMVWINTDEEEVWHDDVAATLTPPTSLCPSPQPTPIPCSEILFINDKRPYGLLEEQPLRNGLVSFPRSGNTWTRILFQQLTRVYSGSIYEDKKAPLPLEHIPGTELVYVIKSHSHDVEHPRRDHNGMNRREHFSFDRVVHLVRNPFDCVWSSMNMQATNSFSQTAPIPNGIASKAMEMLRKWNAHWEAWQAEDPRVPTLHVRYEDLVEDPSTVFTEVRRTRQALADSKLTTLIDAALSRDSSRRGIIGVFDRGRRMLIKPSELSSRRGRTRHNRTTVSRHVRPEDGARRARRNHVTFGLRCHYRQRGFLSDNDKGIPVNCIQGAQTRTNSSTLRLSSGHLCIPLPTNSSTHVSQNTRWLQGRAM